MVKAVVAGAAGGIGQAILLSPQLPHSTDAP
jgi:hypothetical protein